jgi:hypothetical protein
MSKVDPKEFEKNMIHFLTKELQHMNIAQEILNEGYPASYTDDKGRFITEYPNGRKFLVQYDAINKKTYDGEEIFD